MGVVRRSYPEHAAAMYSCHGVFTDLFIFILNIQQIQTPKGLSLANKSQQCIINYPPGVISKTGTLGKKDPSKTAIFGKCGLVRTET